MNAVPMSAASLHPLVPWPVLVVAAAAGLAALVVRLRRHVARGPLARSTAACALALLAAAGPVAGTSPRRVSLSDADVLFVVDTTGSMGALDYDGAHHRLDGVRPDLTAVVEEFPGAHFSLVRFDSSAQVEVPWTTDQAAVLTAISLLHQERTYFASGSSLELPVGAIEQLLPRRGDDGAHRYGVIVYVSDGEQTLDRDPRAPNWLEGFRRISQHVDGGLVLGYGTTAGGRMRVYNGESDGDLPYIYDPDTGGDAVSVLDEANLNAIAEALGVAYVHRTEPSGMASLAAELAERAGRAHAPGGDDERRWYWLPAAAVLVLVVWQLGASARERSAAARMTASPSHRRGVTA